MVRFLGNNSAMHKNLWYTYLILLGDKMDNKG